MHAEHFQALKFNNLAQNIMGLAIKKHLYVLPIIFIMTSLYTKSYTAGTYKGKDV